MSRSYWKAIAARTINRVCKENAGKTEPELKKLIAQAYPFGPREHHPYKVWCEEVKANLNRLFPKAPEKLTRKDTRGTLFEGWPIEQKGGE